ncbi:hypothetical protein KFL_000130380 [Klebsormidium nitens]|uniref:Uncharacterized protein n=1 Tax=Klebsormidium nitens TaxID=105231 RepID=A0A1Y1HPB7_KLENI|nr:hypothetical protein KFL_000130380 [Klebsormidium nitens]|eukprot:GAQ78456.1 hypothetical protein KFL_000130380 [Klebsormidium nitens]
MVQAQQVVAALEAAVANQSPAELEAVYAQVKQLAFSPANEGVAGGPSFATQTLVKCAEAALALRTTTLPTDPALAQNGRGAAVDLLALCGESLTSYFTLNSASPLVNVNQNSGGKNVAQTSSPQEHFAARDQFLGRALFAQGQLAAARCKGLKGLQLREAILAAAEVVLRGVRLAQELGPRHAFLVYNGSVHLWRILRVLNRDGARSTLLPCFESITKSLEWAANQGVKQEEWRAHNLLALAWCLAESGQKDRAVALAQECEKLAKLEDLLAAAAGLRVHLTVGGKGSGAGKAKGELGKDAEGQARALLQAVRSTLPPPSSAADTKPPDKKRPPSSQSASSDKAETEKQILEAWRLADPSGASLVASPSPTPDQIKAITASVKGVNTDLVADVAWTSALAGVEGIAERAAGRAAQGKTLGGRARAELALCKIALDRENVHLLSDADLDPAAAARRADVIRRAEGSLSSFLRAGDCAGVEDTCQLIWQAALPLLDPSRRHVAARALRAAASALETVGSGMHRLRAQIHLELAELHQAEELLSKAEDEARKGFELDYEAPPGEVEAAGCDRPLDRHLEPLLKRMKLKRDIYSDPDRPMDKALMIIERAREAKKADVRADLLAKAAAELTLAEAEEQTERERIEEEGRKGRAEAAAAAAAVPIAEPGGKGSKGVKGKAGKETPSKGRETPSNEAGVETSQKGVTFGEERFRQGAKDRARLWAAAVRIAVEAKLWEVAHVYTQRVLGIDWTVNRDRDMVLLHAEVAFLDAEACAGVLKERGIEVIPPEKGDPDRKSAGERGTPDVAADVGGSEKAETNAAESSSSDQTGAESVGKTDSRPRESATSNEGSFDARPYQERAFGGYHEGAQKGLALNEAWLVTNAAASLWNLYLPLLKAKRYAPLVPVFQPMLDAVLTLPATIATRDAVTVCGVANALASGHVHACLQRLFRESRSAPEVPPLEATEPPAPDKTKVARGKSPNPKNKEAVTKSTDKALPTGDCKAANEAPSVKPLPSDQAPKNQSDAPDLAPTDAPLEERSYTELLSWGLEGGRKRCENAPELSAASEVCSKVIEKMQGVDETVLKVLVATQAKVQGLRGLAGAAGGDHALGASGKAVALIELASNTAESAGVRAKAVADAVEALQKGDGTELKAGGVKLELWTKVARGALALGDLQRAITCCRVARGMAEQLGGKQAPAADKENVPHAAAPRLKPLSLAPYHCYWLSLAEMVEGQATTQLINPARQSPAAQDALRVKALERFLEGVRWGGKAGRTDLMCRAAVLWWNSALPLTKDAPGRSLLSATCQPLLEALLAARVRALPPELHASLFLVLLECLAEQERWEDGMKWTDLAVPNTASGQHKHLWAVKTKFMVKMGRPMSEELDRMGDKDGEVRARMWATLAAQSDDPFERLTAHQRAIDALEDTPWMQVPYMIQYAEYLASQGYPGTDSEDVLLCAADILHDLEEEEEEEDNEAEAGHQSRGGGGSIASGSKHGRERRSTMASSRQGGGSVAGRSTTGRSALGGGSLRGSQHGSLRPSQAPTRKSMASRRDGGSQAGGSRKGTVVGKSTVKSGVTSVSAAGPSLFPPEPKRLLELLRIYTALAKTSASLAERRENALLAQHFGVRLMRHVLGEVNGHVAEKRAALAEVANFAVDQESRLARSLSKAAGSAVTTRPSRLGGSLSSVPSTPPDADQQPPVAIPSTPQEWPRVDLAEQVRAGVKLGNELAAALAKAVKGLGLSAAAKAGGSKNKINGSDLYRQLAKKIKGLEALLQEDGPKATPDPFREAIDDPSGLLATLGSLESCLRQAGMDLHALPLRQLAYVTADVVMGRADVALAQKLAMVELLESFALRAEAAEWEKFLGVLAISPEERKKAREEVEQRLEAKRLAAKKVPAESRSAENGDEQNEKKKTGNDSEKRVLNGRKSPDALEKSVSKAIKLRSKEHPFQARHAWLATAAFLMTRGRFSGARAFLTEASAHACAFDDEGCAAACALHLARLTLLENRHVEALSLVQEAVSSEGEVFQWVERAVAAAQILLEELPRGSGFSKARVLLKAGVERFAALAKHTGSKSVGSGRADSGGRTGMGLDAGIAEATLLQELAGVVASESRHSVRVGDKNRAVKTAREAVEILQKCCDRWRELGGGAPSLSATLAHVAALDWLQRQEGSTLARGTSEGSPRAAADAQRRALLEALNEGRALLQTSKPAGTSAVTSAPLARQVAQILEALARAELAMAAGASEAAEESGGRVEIPLVEGRNSAPVRRWVDEAEELGPAAVQRRREANREQAHEERAVIYASDALALLGDGPDLCHVAAALHCTLGMCLLEHSAREMRNEETLRKVRQRNQEENGREEPLKTPADGLAETGPAWPLEVQESSGTVDQKNKNGNPIAGEKQSDSFESGQDGPLLEPAKKTDTEYLEKIKPAEARDEGPSDSVKRLQQQGVNALEKAVSIGLREGRYDVVSEAAVRLADFHARAGPAGSQAKCAECVALAQGCKARAFLKDALETACARDDAQIVALRKLASVKSREGRFSGWPEPPFADFRVLQNPADDLDVTSAEAAVRAASPCAWGVLEGVKNQSFGEAIARLPSDAAGLILHLDEKRGALYAVSIGPVPSEFPTGQVGEKGKADEAAGVKDKGGPGSKRRTSKGKGGVPQKETPQSEKSGEEGAEPKTKERRIEVIRLDLEDGGRPLFDLVKGFEVWRNQAKRAVARAHVAPVENRADGDVSAVSVGKLAPGTANVGKPKGKETPPPGEASGLSKVAKGAEKAGAPEKGPRADSRAGRASKPPSRPASRLQRTPLDADLEERWTALIDRMREFFQPLKAAFDAATGRATESSPQGDRSESRQSDKPSPPEGPIQNAASAAPLAPRQLVLFLDGAIAALPFECLPEFQPPQVLSVSRDFSLAVFAHRVARAAASKPSHTLPLDLRRMCYVVDPQNEDKPRAARLPTRVTPPLAEAFSEISQALAGNFNAKEWRGLTGAEHVPSDGEIQRLVATSSGMIFVGVGRFLAYVSAAALAALDLGTCQLAVLAAMSVSDESLRRQAFLDNRKSHEARELERPASTAALLTLCGVSSIAVNQAVSTIDANQTLVSGLLQSLTSQPGVNVGQALREASSKVDATELRSLSANMVLYGLPMLTPG